MRTRRHCFQRFRLQRTHSRIRACPRGCATVSTLSVKATLLSCVVKVHRNDSLRFIVHKTQVEQQVGYREFVHAVSAMFLLPAWASFSAAFAVSRARYRVSRSLRSRLTLNDARRRYLRFFRNRKQFLTAKQLIKVELEVAQCQFVYVVSAIFLLPVWLETAIGGLFSPAMRVLRCVVASRLAQSATGRQPTTGILLSVQREVNIRLRRSP